MNVIIRTDAGGPHGYGHAKRMLGLAQALRRRDPKGLVEVLTKSPAVKAVMGSLPVAVYHPQAREVDVLFNSQAARDADVLVVDHKTPYPEELWEELRRRCRVVRVDAPHAEAKSCDLLLIPNGHQAPTVVHRLSRVFEDRLCYGLPYALLDAEVGRWRPSRWGLPPQRIAFVAGASDPAGALAHLLAMTEELPAALPDVWLQYLVGEAAAGPVRVGRLAATQQVVGFHPRYLVGAGLVVTLFGVMPYNLLRLGVPALTVGHTREHAEGSAQLMAATGATVDLGYLPTLGREDLCAALVDLWADQAARKRMAHLGPRLVDGQGAERAADAILALGG